MMDYQDIISVLGADAVADVEGAVERAYIRSRESTASGDGRQALQELLVGTLATIIGLPSEREFARVRLHDATIRLHEIVTLMGEIEINEADLASTVPHKKREAA